MTGPDDHRTSERAGVATWIRRLLLLVALAAWVWACITWIFPWVVTQGLDPTLGT